MLKIDQLDFQGLNADRRLQFVENFAKIACENFSHESFKKSVLAQLLIFTRWWNSYRLMGGGTSAPPVLNAAIEMLWDWEEEKISQETLERFQKSLSDGAMEILTGEDWELNQDPISDAFYQKYFQVWPRFYDRFLSCLCLLMEQTVEGETDWTSVADMLDIEIGDILIEDFEEIYPNDAMCTAAQDEERWIQICQSPTFCQVIQLLQEDVRAALENTPLEELRKRYGETYLFPPEECAKISVY